MPQGRKTRSSEFLHGQIGNYRFAVPVRKCLDSHDFLFFFFKSVRVFGMLNKIFKPAIFFKKFHFVGIKVFWIDFHFLPER